jgi:hypothetical protein
VCVAVTTVVQDSVEALGRCVSVGQRWMHMKPVG